MSTNEKVYEYEGDGITVLWKPKFCIHSEKCVKALPNVYKPKERRWIQTENATAEELRKQVDTCPSGALAYRIATEENKTKENMSEKNSIEVTIIPNGPLMCDGSLIIKNPDGTVEEKSKAAFCRCGASANKPFCDGSHKAADFQG